VVRRGGKDVSSGRLEEGYAPFVGMILRSQLVIILERRSYQQTIGIMAACMCVCGAILRLGSAHEWCARVVWAPAS
jgi:hypothetical protein